MNHVGWVTRPPYRGMGRGALGMPTNPRPQRRARGAGSGHSYAGRFAKAGRHQAKHPKTR